MQKKCLRSNSFSYYLEPTEFLFKDLNILALKTIGSIEIFYYWCWNIILVLSQNLLYWLLPHYLRKKIHNYNTKYCSSLHPAIGKSEATYGTISYHAILIWNYLWKLICINVTLACFKKWPLEYLQTHLIPYRTVRWSVCVCI